MMAFVSFQHICNWQAACIFTLEEAEFTRPSRDSKRRSEHPHLPDRRGSAFQPIYNRFTGHNFLKGVRVLPSASGTRIRIAQQEDSIAIAAVHAASWRGSYGGIVSDKYLNDELESERLSIWEQRLEFPKTNQYVTVAEQETQIVGFACAFGAEDEPLGTMLDNLHVSTSQKGKGTGRKLVRDIAFWCDRSYPSKGLVFWVCEQNIPARRFYELLEGVVVGEAHRSAPDCTVVKEISYA
jgi:GNAT superfamily N-acetyltransferase